MTPKVSIIVPVYNVERYLGECLASLRAQTLMDIEIVCIDDASTDGSACLLAAAAAQDSRITILKHERNRGLSAARNTGIHAARAAWVLFVDSDDIASRRLCERTLDAANRSSADVVFFDHVRFVDGCPPPDEPAAHEPRRADRRELLLRQAFAWTKLVSAELLRSKHIDFPEGLCFEDVPVHWRLALESENPVFLEEALVWYRQRLGSITYRTDWTRADGLKIYDLVGERLRAAGLWDDYGPMLMTAEMANFANTHAYYDMANRTLVGRVRDEARRRMTASHWAIALHDKGLLGWQRDYILARCRPKGAGCRLNSFLPSVRFSAREQLRRLRHLLMR